MRAITLALVLAACGDNLAAPRAGELDFELRMFFRMDETGDIPRVDAISHIKVFPWKKLDVGVYHQDGLGTTRVPAIVGDGQHIAGADGYHFAQAHYPEMAHDGGSFTWVGWASVDPHDTYSDHQTLLAKWASVPDTAVPGDRREYRVWFEPGLERWRFEVSRDGLEGEGHSIAVTHPAEIARGAMYFIEAWHDADADTVNLRVSDRQTHGEVASVTWDAGVFPSTADLDIGAQNQCADHHLQGTIDALGYWQRALTDDELLVLWNDGDGTELGDRL